ncbi:MAG TPA: glucuronate isomerase [Chitinophagaceae bacterium]|nr:glucuronate isomerase [Chitinophagaceae bacterium]
MHLFLDEDFLLQNQTARTIYHDHVESLPILDYHSHLPSPEIAENKPFPNITEVWLGGDHYKWRAMRANGIPENYITGQAGAEEKFLHWAACVPYTMGNPLYHWTHLELKRIFGINQLLDPGSAAGIFRACKEKLADPGFRPKGILEKMRVEVSCTTDDPVSGLSWHKQIRESGFRVRVLPGFRPDLVLNPSDPGKYNVYLDQIAQVAGTEIRSFGDLMEALSRRVAYFSSQGCRLSDHGLEQMPEPGNHNPETIFNRIRQGKSVNPGEQECLQHAILKELCLLYHQQGWVQQFHLGALRNANTRIRIAVGGDAGTDSIGDFPQATRLSAFLDSLDRSDRLARTILYNLNPADNGVFATMAGNFNDGSIPGKVQWGPAWWFLDQKDGIEAHLETVSNYGLLSRFTGMVTDSRSFLSFPRHEYFRRILCNRIGDQVEKGELPADLTWLGWLCGAVSYHNAKSYFGF